MITANLDYLYFVYGLAFFLLAAGLSARQRGSAECLPWHWLARFGLLHGTYEWLRLVALDLGDGPAFKGIRLALLTASFVMLLVFGRAGARAQGVKLPGAWSWAIALLVLLSGMGVLLDPSGLDAACRYSVGLPSGLLAGWVLWRESARAEAHRRLAWRLASLAMLCYALTTGLIVPRAAFFPASHLNQDVFLAALGIPVQFIRSSCAIACVLGLYWALRPSADDPRASRLARWALPATLLPLLIAGFWATNWHADNVDSERRERLLQQVTALAQTISPEDAKALSFTATDKTRTDFQRLRAQFMAYRPVIGCRGIYTMRMRNGKILFGPESYAETDPQASPPGTVYAEPTPELLAIFRNGRALTEGPLADEYGTFVSALAPVFDRRSGAVELVVGLDIEGTDWQAGIARQRCVVILCVLVLASIMLGSRVLLQRRQRLPLAQHGWLLHAEVYLLAAFGLALTLIATVAFHDAEIRARRVMFGQLAAAQAKRGDEAFRNLELNQLGGLARFIACSQHFSAEEFYGFVAPVVHQSGIQAMEWVPSVPAAAREAFEARARAEGMENFTIWQKGPAQQQAAATGRDRFYPVWYVAPLAGNETTPGYDLGSEPMRRAALEAALASGKPTATDRVTLVQESTGQAGMLVFYPIFTEAHDGRELRGFALVVLRLGHLLRAMFITGQADNVPAVVELRQLQSGKSPRFLASSRPVAPQDRGKLPANDTVVQPARGDLAMVYPLFAFGKCYALSVHAQPAFLDAHPARAGWISALVGLLLTIILSTFALFLTHRRGELEGQVLARTVELRESKERLSATLRSIGDGVIAVDAAGMVTSLNTVAETLLGWHTAEAHGRHISDIFHILHTLTRQPAEIPVARALREDRIIGLADHTSLITRDGTELQIADSCGPIHDAAGTVIGAVFVFHDVTQEYRQREQLRESEARFDQLAEQSGTFVWEVDTQGLYTYVSRVSVEVLGYQPDELIGQMHFYDLHPQPGREAFRNDAFAVFKQLQPFRNLENPAIAKDGRLLWLSTNGMPLLTPDGTLRGYRGGDTDITARHQAEEALRAERDLFSAGPVFTLERDASDRWPVRQVSRNIVAILGYTAEEIMANAFRYASLIHPDDLARVADELTQHASLHTDFYEQSYRVRTKNGEYRWFYDFTKLVRNEVGDVTRIRGYLFDQTNIKDMERALVSERERLASIIEGTHVGTWEWNIQTGETVFNERWAEIVGYALTDLAPVSIDTWMRLAHPDDLRQSEERLEHHFRGESDYYQFESRMRHKNGDWVWVLDRGKVGSWTPDGKPQLMFGTHQDITGRKRAEIALAQHAQLEALLATISMQFISVKPHDTERLIQQALSEVGQHLDVDRVYVFAYTPDLTVCSNTYEWCAPGAEPQINNLQGIPSAMLPWWTAQMRARNNIIIPDMSGLPPDARAERELLESQSIKSLLVVPLLWGDKVEGFMGFDSVQVRKDWTPDDIAPLELLAGIIHNAAKHKEFVQQLSDMNASLEKRVAERTHELHDAQAQLYLQDKMASVGQLAAGLAHEINNPVSFVATNFATLEKNVLAFQEILTGYRELALADTSRDADQAEALARLRQREDEVALDFVVADMPNLFAESRDGFRRISDIVGSMRSFARKDEPDMFVPFNLNKGIQDTLVLARNAYKYSADVTLELSPIPEVPCVAGQINQVLLNLIVNAAQAIEGAAADSAEKGRIVIRTGERPDGVFCEVADNGPGIPEAVAPHIFDPFFTTKPPGEGSGLGLSISYDIMVNKHHGSLTMHNQPGGGACFCLTLPHQENASSPETANRQG